MPMIPRTQYCYRKPMREVSTESGSVRGVPGGNYICTVFKGIPYAKPPVGELRWKRPQPVEPWEGVRECYSFGPASYQLDRSYEVNAKNLYPTPYEVSEDSLYLNIWTPAQSPEDNLPVFFWTHGGGNFGGFGSELENDGEGFAKRGVILVTYNYRLGPLGFLAHPELSAENEQGISGNYALFDAIAALEWVRRNIKNFGGDPNNITIGGQSAGCMMTACLAVSPLTRGKYSKICFHSGLFVDENMRSILPELTLKEAENMGVQFMKAHGYSSLAELRALPAEELLRETEFERKAGLFRQISDGYALMDAAFSELFAGNFDDVPVIGLMTADEGMTDGKRQVISGGVKAFCEMQLSLGRTPAHAFRFSRALPGDDDGAWHTSELFYMFETISRTWRRMTGYDFELQTRFADYWANFIKTGDPNGDGLVYWKPYTQDCPGVMDLGTVDRMIL